ncbi:hypothetical protein OG349_13750 [Streptomyces sp. NBC_01317]|uniref:hypothetical protein n=1 Tax=Streptomyces sp. NBC_01317 TaxID=2903822 RepID=UPI002E15AA75|nr:hypothetical protein OG349_13750 [Streptomyces sp. NBC_01317]
MSFGDPNNPYGQQGQQPAQPGYGYPQQGQQPGQPGYGYPQAPPVQPYGGGFPAGPTEMPGSVKAARVMLWVIAGLNLIGAALFALGAVSVSAAKNDAQLKDDVDFQQLADYSGGVLWAAVVFAVAWLAFAVYLAVKLGKGGNGIRIATIVFGVITAILGVYPFIGIGLVYTVLAILITVFVAKADGAAWFNRNNPQTY